MKNLKNNIILALIIAGSSIGIYFIQIIIFERTQDTFFYLLQDLAFIPIQVVVVTLVFNKLLNSREKQQKIKKINVIITTFYIEAGSKLIEEMSAFDANFDRFRQSVTVKDLSGPIAPMKRRVKDYNWAIDADSADLKRLKGFLLDKKIFLLTMLENNNLMEHDSFTDMLWAIFHITDELQCRENLDGLPKADRAHISGDILRAYKLLILEWLDYIAYLNNDYPYLFSLEVRKNPFIGSKDVTIKE